MDAVLRLSLVLVTLSAIAFSQAAAEPAIPLARAEGFGLKPRISYRPHGFRFTLHVRRLIVLLLSILCRSWVPFLLLGLVSRCTRRFASVFFCYAGHSRYARHYSYSWSKPLLRWFPSIIGTFRQGGEWGLICASPVTEKEFTEAENRPQLLRLMRRLERVQGMLGARQLSLAGILPTVIRDTSNRGCMPPAVDYTTDIVCQAIQKICRIYFEGIDHNLVLLGGGGRIGTAVRQRLNAAGVEATVLDIANGESTTRFERNSATPVLLVDVSRPGVIERYADKLPLNSVVLNEVFPEPDRQALNKLRSRHIPLIHISGVHATVYPKLPFGYSNAIPCCAVHAPSLQPILVEVA